MKTQLLTAAIATVCAFFLLVASQPAAPEPVDLSVIAEDTGLCDNSDLCFIEYQTRGEFTRGMIETRHHSIDPGGEAGFDVQILKRNRQDGASVYEIMQQESTGSDPLCLDILQVEYLKIPEGQISNDDGIFEQGMTDVFAYECFIDGEERSDYLDNTILLQLLD
ncbi:MAG: hypothetical protein TR69_WS6001000583 [candidate division WS6 bacterium OLB20]|uniref:Uncharacterized protein n=1 Tax=candidate division WS6 bacterium OLB20 TaxID=1617426 RepID=A0A136LYA3_9BACT|nr:MAG: hypothetical protein TR69_WS6001000583 [candidate division WS6 bacterium OLB20]